MIKNFLKFEKELIFIYLNKTTLIFIYNTNLFLYRLEKRLDHPTFNP